MICGYACWAGLVMKRSHTLHEAVKIFPIQEARAHEVEMQFGMNHYLFSGYNLL